MPKVILPGCKKADKNVMALLERPCFYCQALCPPVGLAILSMLRVGEYAVKRCEANHNGVIVYTTIYLGDYLII
ncbi:hypothetical protein IVZ55_20755 [Salmonella enterica subsp. enterica serovar Worthington]|nr:hypothetical protein [Salmonella enterica subsp. enterica serovar Worthington]